MKVPYLVGTASKPQPSLGDSLQRPRPIMAVRITGPSHHVVRDALLDTGSDDTVFPDGIAATIGLDLSQAVSHNIVLAGRGLIRCRYAPALLRITDAYNEAYEWSAMVGFVAVRIHYPLLGYAGFLQFFDADFRGADQEVILTPNRAFPGQRI